MIVINLTNGKLVYRAKGEKYELIPNEGVSIENEKIVEGMKSFYGSSIQVISEDAGSDEYQEAIEAIMVTINIPDNDEAQDTSENKQDTLNDEAQDTSENKQDSLNDEGEGKDTSETENSEEQIVPNDEIVEKDEPKVKAEPKATKSAKGKAQTKGKKGKNAKK